VTTLRMAEFSFHHGGVSVPSLDEAIEWYGRVLGFEIERQFYIAAARSRTAIVRKGALRFEIFEVEGALPLPDDRRDPTRDVATHGNKHVAFRIANLDAFLSEMAEKQADIALVVREAFGAGCFIRDCAGNLIEFVEEDRP
jgi:catechol 2,3-dioxygenase-like lactoylglutathione lyase family enzyme